MPSGSAGWSRLFNVGLRLVFAVLTATVVAVSFRPALGEIARLNMAGGVAVVGLGVVQVVVVVFAGAGFSRLVSDAVLVIATAGFLVLFLVGQPDHGAHIGWWPTPAVVAVQGWVLAFGGRWRWWLGGSAWLAYAALRLTGTVLSPDPFAMGVIELVSNAELALMLILAVHAVRRLSARADEAEAERLAATLAERKQELAERRRRQVSRFLHDNVLHTLRAVARTGREDARTPDGADVIGAAAEGGVVRGEVDAVRGMAAATAARLRAGDLHVDREEPASLRAQLLGIAAVTGVRVEVTGRAPRVPGRVLAALVQAAAEAVRNSARHAGVDTVRIHVESDRDGVLVQVVDDGKGFQQHRLGHGLRESVVDRMLEVGGSATILSAPNGTTVSLRWRPSATFQRMASVWREMTGALVPIALPGIIGTAIIGLLVADELANPGLATAGMLLVVVVGLGALRPDGALLPPRWLVLLVAASIVGLGANILAAAPTTGNGFHLFMAGGVTPLLVILVAHGRVRWTLPAVVLVWATLLALGVWRFGFDRMTVGLVGSLTAPLAVLGVIGFRFILWRVGRRTILAREETLESMLRREQLECDQVERDQRIRRVTERLLPFLDAITTGTLDPHTPEVVRRATALELGVRAELEATSEIEHTDRLAAAVADARALDWELDVRIPAPDREARTVEAIELLKALDHSGAGSGRATLSALDGVALVVQSPDSVTLERWRGRSDIDVEWEENARWGRLSVRLPT